MFVRQEVLDRIYPEFPAKEYEERIRRMRESMEKHEIDALLTTDKKNTEYFTGSMVMLGPWVSILSLDAEPVILIPAFLAGSAEKTAWARNIKKNPTAHMKTDPMYFAKFIVENFKELGLSKGTIGLEYGEDLVTGLQISEFDYVRSNLPDAKFVSGEDVIWDCRMIKSKLELEKMKNAAEIAMAGYSNAREEVKKGMTEIEISEVFKRTYVEEQAKRKHNTQELGIFNIRSGPERYHMADSFNQDRKVQDGETLVMNVGAWYRRYYANWSRTAFVGKPKDGHMKGLKAIEKCFEVIAEETAPGIKAGDLYDKAVEPLRDSFGSGEVYATVGIGCGLYPHEPPYIGKDRKDILQPGMVFTVVAWSYDIVPDGLGILGFEHEFVVTESGNRPIVPFEDELLWVLD
ncbi:MAG: M24 family metallopeptidase [Candidatus Thorarchaeota archaeon]